MAFYRLACSMCHHTFYRVEVRCETENETYVCPVCGAATHEKTFVEPIDGQKTAEQNPCCGGTHGGTCGCGH